MFLKDNIDSLFVWKGANIESSEHISQISLTYWQDAYRRFRSRKVNIAGVVILAVIAFFTIFGPCMTTYSYNESIISAAQEAPSRAHYFGTDSLGRDFWARVWVGGRISILIGLLAAFLQGVVGVIIGSIAGFVGGAADNLIMRLTEFLMSIPYLVWVTMLMLVMGSGIFPMVLALTLTGWLSMARLVRGQVLKIKNEDYVLAAISLGVPTPRLLFKYMIPNSMGVIIVNLTFAIPNAIFMEAFLSFVGIGIKSPMTSWGQQVSLGMSLIYSSPLQLLIPCICISLTMFSLQLIGDGLRDSLDPNLRR